jgi:hypothetical protein
LTMAAYARRAKELWANLSTAAPIPYLGATYLI